MTLILDYPWYFLLLCVVLGAVYAFILYWLTLRRKGAARREAAFSRRTTILLSLLRTVAVATITFLLLSPLVKREVNRKEKPIIIIAEDNSKSLDYTKDSAYYHTTFQEQLSDVADELSSEYDVHRYRYGSALTDSSQSALFSEKKTDISKMLSEIAERYYHRNIGAIIVTGDGIYNNGFNPVNAVSSLPCPIYTVAMGDTTVHRDASISNVRFNRIAYLGNSFPMDVTINAARMKGESSTLSVICEGRRLFSKQITFDDEHFSTTESIVLDADRAGLHNYIIEIAPLRDEQTTHNNRRVIPIEVIDGHQKVAIIAAVPHPDVGALQRAVSKNQNYEVETFLAKDFNKDPRDYNLLILHQLPSKVADANINIAALLEKGTPAMFVLGSQSDLARLNSLHVGLEVYTRIDRQNEAAPILNKNFTYFSINEDITSKIEHFPPLLSPFGDYKLGVNAQTLFNAKVGSVNSGLPLIVATQQQERRYSFITGEGLWRWRLADYQSNQTHSNFDEMMDKLVVFTALRVNKERFHVEVKNIFSETEAVIFEAQLYNDNYEPVNTPDVELVVSQRDAPTATKAKRYLFNRSAMGYSLNLGALEPGSYSYTATTKFNGKNYSASGSFLVENLQLEAINLVADHSLLNTLSSLTGGEMVDAKEVGQLPEKLKKRDDLKTLIFSETQYSNMLNLPYLFIFIVVLLATEWIVRKYNGEV